jgi:branched-chain amino acid transport system substrate-binding protein
MKRASVILIVAALAMAGSSCSHSPDPIRVGAIYPLSGPQGPGGIDEFRGVRLAADLVNGDGGVGDRPIQLDPVDVPGADAVPGAVATLAGRGVRFLVGSYGSTISQPAAAEASRRGMLFWETGAVGSMAPAGDRSFFRVAPGGAVLGRSAVSFVARQLAPLLHRTAPSLRFAVASVDDAYGNAVAAGAVDEIRALALPLAGEIRYDALRLNARTVISRIAAMSPDVLFVVAYMQDGIALRREMVRQRLHLVANIGTSSSYCMPAFGAALGRDAVGLFASDKPDSDALDTSGLRPSARALLRRASDAFRARYGQEMSAPALAGFSAAWALFHDIMPAAARITTEDVAAQALRTRISAGGLPNGSGLELAPRGSPDPGGNLRAASVIWEWTGVGRRAVVWPPAFATTSIDPIPIEP